MEWKCLTARIVPIVSARQFYSSVFTCWNFAQYKGSFFKKTSVVSKLQGQNWSSILLANPHFSKLGLSVLCFCISFIRLVFIVIDETDSKSTTPCMMSF